jgi:Holliday junction resolvase RusA-like endonuclease
MRIFIPGDPVAQPRPTISTRGGFARAYVDAKHPIHAYKQAVRLAYVNAGGEILEGPVEVRITCWFSRPKSHSKKRSVAPEPKAIKPDSDNLGKAILDSLNGIAYHDDSQVYSLQIEKWYIGVGGTAGTEIEVLLKRF